MGAATEELEVVGDTGQQMVFGTFRVEFDGGIEQSQRAVLVAPLEVTYALRSKFGRIDLRRGPGVADRFRPRACE